MSDYGRPHLPYPFSYVLDLVQPLTIESVVPSIPPTLSPICNTYTVRLTPNQVRMFTSAVQAGLDLLYPDNWQDLFTLWDNARANVNNPFWQYSLGDCSGMEACDIVAYCIENSDAVRDILRDMIEDVSTGKNGEAQEPNDDTIDCVYGATGVTYDLLLDCWLNLKTQIDAATDALEVMLDFLPPGIADIPEAAINGIELLFDVGTALYDTWINDSAQENAWRCGIFDAMCERGTPYLMYDIDINAGFQALGDNSPPVVGVLTALQLTLNYSLVKKMWALRTDEDCSNDWETLCDCIPSTCTDYNFVTGTAGWSPLTSPGFVFAQYVAMFGWEPQTRPSRVGIKFTAPTTGVLTGITVTRTTALNGDLRETDVYLDGTPTGESVSASSAVYSWGGSIPVTAGQEIGIYEKNDALSTGTVSPGYVQSVELCFAI